MDRILIQIDGLKSLEDQEKWFDACELLFHQWMGDKANADMLVRATLECWYVMLEGSVIGFADDSEYMKIGSMLSECAEYGISNLRSSFSVIWAFSYMTSVSALPFSWKDETDHEYLRWEAIGEQLRTEGLSLYPDHILSQITFCTFSSHKEYMDSIRSSEDKIQDIFPGDSALEVYFREMYSVKDLF